MVLQNVVTNSIADPRRFFMGLVGQGPALDAFMRLVGRRDFSNAFPRAKLVGWVPTPGEMPGADVVIPRLLQNQPVLPDIPLLFSARPGIQLAIDLSPDSRYMEHMRACAPANVSLCTAEALLNFCSAAEDGSLVIGGGETLRKAEKLFALLVDQMDGDVLVLNGKGVIEDVNQHAANTRGLSRQEMVGKTCAEADTGGRFCSDDESNCPFHMAQNTGAQAEHTFVQVMPNGRVRYIHALCFPVLDALGVPVQYLYIRRDVTEKQSLEQRLQQTEKMAAIGELSTYMAHEIRNPLFSIGGFANALLRNPSLNDLAREKARIIYDESRRLDTILTSILNFARPTEQTMGVFEPDIVARQTIELMTIGSAERGITVETTVEPNLPKALGNAENLKQCLINIVKNALEAMPTGGVLTVTVRRNNGFVQIDVRDTGKGIAPNIQDQVFSPFFSTKHDGAGLGLAMARKVIEEMGGKVLLESQPGKGTHVALQIPAAPAVPETQNNGASSGAGLNGAAEAAVAVATGSPPGRLAGNGIAPKDSEKP